MDINEIVLGKAGWTLTSSFLACLSPDRIDELSNVLLGLNPEFGRLPRTLRDYQDRVVQLGLTRLRKVLDVGCGSGPWSVALARENEFVFSSDTDTGRLHTARELLFGDNRANAEVFFAPAENHSSIADGSIDGILCHGVFMFTDFLSTLSEWRRILHSDGVIYVTFNTPRYYFFRLRRRTKDGGLREIRFSTTMILRSILSRPRGALTVRRFGRLVEQSGFRIVGISELGSLNASHAQPSTFERWGPVPPGVMEALLVVDGFQVGSRNVGDTVNVLA